MIHRLALSLAAAALVAAGPAFAQAPAAAAPPAPPPAQVAPPPAPAAETAAPEKAPKHEKHAKPEKQEKSEKSDKHAKHEKAKGHGTPQTHHCVKDGKVMADLTNKKCVSTGGVWQRDTEAPVAPPPVAAPRPAP